MRFLILAPQNVIPATDGGKAGIYYPLRALARRHEVHFAFPVPSSHSDDEVLLRRYESLGVHPVVLPPVGRDFPEGLLAGFKEGLPFKVAKYNSRPGVELLTDYVRRHSISTLWVNHLHMMPTALALKERLGVFVVLREHNFEAELVAQYAALHRSPLFRFVARWQWPKMLQYERHAWTRADRTLFISDLDLAQAREHGAPSQPGGPLYDIVPSATEPPESGPDAPPLTFVYPLRFSSVQNRYSARRFLAEVWAPFVAANPGATLAVTGCDASDLARELELSSERQAQLGVRACGFVEDYHAFLRTRRYFVSPTYLGSGLRVKLIEAMGQGCLCLCSELDRRSICLFEDGENLVSFRDLEDFTRQVQELEQSGATRRRVRRSAWELARAAFSEATYVQRAEEALGSAPARGSRPRESSERTIHGGAAAACCTTSQGEA